MGLTVLWYGCAAIRWTRPSTAIDAFVLRHGTGMGVAIGIVWIVQMTFENIVVPRIGKTKGVDPLRKSDKGVRVIDDVRKLIRRHNGEIEVESGPGRTEFRVRLPISTAGGSH